MKNKDTQLLEEAYEKVLESTTLNDPNNQSDKTPKAGQVYKWIESDSLVKILDVKADHIPAKEHKDGSYSGPRTRYTVKIKDITPGGKYEGSVLSTPFTTSNFQIVK